MAAAGLWVLAADGRAVERSVVASALARGDAPARLSIPASDMPLRVALRFGRAADSPAAHAEVVGTRCVGVRADGARVVLDGSRQAEATFAGGLKAVGRLSVGAGPLTLTCRRPAGAPGAREVVVLPDPGPGISPWGIALVLGGAGLLVTGATRVRPRARPL